jgi:hypothetical protein
LISNNQDSFTVYPWLFWWPGLFIVTIALASTSSEMDCAMHLILARKEQSAEKKKLRPRP